MFSLAAVSPRRLISWDRKVSKAWLALLVKMVIRVSKVLLANKVHRVPWVTKVSMEVRVSRV